MVAKEWNGDLVFLHEVAPMPLPTAPMGQVAKLAGVPASVVARARSVLERLEGEKAAAACLDGPAPVRRRRAGAGARPVAAGTGVP